MTITAARGTFSVEVRESSPTFPVWFLLVIRPRTPFTKSANEHLVLLSTEIDLDHRLKLRGQQQDVGKDGPRHAEP